jgi:hypothetical protein
MVLEDQLLGTLGFVRLRFLLVHIQKWGKSIPNYHKLYQNCYKIYQTAVEYTNIFHCKTLRNLPKLGFLDRKYTIWQPWTAVNAADFLVNNRAAHAHDITLPKLGHLLLSYHTTFYLRFQANQGCQIFLGYVYNTKTGKKFPNEHKIHQIVIKYPKCP